MDLLKGMGGQLGVGWRKWWTDVPGWLNQELEELGSEGWRLWSDACHWLSDAKEVGDRVDVWLSEERGDVVKGLEIAKIVEQARFRKGLVGGNVESVSMLVDTYLQEPRSGVVEAASWVWSKGDEFMGYRAVVGESSARR